MKMSAVLERNYFKLATFITAELKYTKENIASKPKNVLKSVE